MSVTSVGVKNLTALIYQVMEDGADASRKLREAVRESPGDINQIEFARRKVNYLSTYLAGLIKAWETVTGEIWGEVLPGWRPERS